MRTTLVVLAITIFLIISLPFYLISLVIGLFSEHAKIRFSQTAAKIFFGTILVFSATKYKVLGRENIPTKEAVLFAANHRSLSDIAVAYVTLPILTGFVAKKEMAKIPVMSWWMKNLNCLFLDRENPREGLKTILTGVENIKKGYSMFIMPEGTRNHESEMLPFKEGSLKMAEKTGCAIIPVAITNSDAVFERQFPWVKKATVYIHYGKPIYPNNMPKEDRKFIGNYVRDVIASMLEEDKNLPL